MRAVGIREKSRFPEIEVGTQGDEMNMRGAISGRFDNLEVSRLISKGIKKLK
jgi:hypothetical protein